MIKFIILSFIGMLLSFFLYCLALYLFEIITLITLDETDMMFDLYRRNTVNDSSPFLLHNIPIFFIFIFSFYWTYFKSSQYQRFKKLKYCNALYKRFKYGGRVNKKENQLKIAKKLPKSFCDADEYIIMLLFPILVMLAITILFLYHLKIVIYPCYRLLLLIFLLILLILLAFVIYIGVYMSQKIEKH
jgi:hypothetical protein